MDYLEKILKKTGWSSLITSIIFAILGIILIMKPEGTVKVVSYILGAMFVLVGIYYSTQIGKIFRILIGLWIIYSSIIRINLSLKLKNIDSKIWIYSLIIATLMLICGIFTICNSSAIIVTIGIIILVYSILDIIESIIFLNNVKKIS